MGEACKEPLLRRCREEFSQDIGVQKVTALLYMLKEHPFPEFFDEFVQYYAKQYRGFSTLAAFDDPRVPGLIQTFLKREPLFRSETMGEKSRSLMLIDNPKWDALVRNVLAQELPKLNNEREVGQLVDLFVQKRIFDMEMDKAELAEWVKKLRVKGMIKVRALAMCEPRIEEHDPDLVYAIRPGQEPLELSWKELARQVREAPADKDFLDTYQRWAGESDLSATLNVWIRNRRFMNEDADTEIIFRRILQDKEVSRIILAHLASLFGLFAERMSYTSSDGRHYTTRTVTVPGTYVQIQQTASHISADDTNAMLNASLPGYFMECFGDPEFSGDRTLAAKLLIYIEGPEAAKVLETWLETEDWQLKTVVQEALDQHGYRDAIRLRHREIFQQLCAGEISPDEIVSKQ